MTGHSEYDKVVAARTCGCNESAAQAGEETWMFECAKCRPDIQEALFDYSAYHNGPDRTDPGYWLDNC